MHFGRNNHQFDYTLDKKTLQTVQEEKDLGIISHLRFFLVNDY